MYIYPKVPGSNFRFALSWKLCLIKFFLLCIFHIWIHPPPLQSIYYPPAFLKIKQTSWPQAKNPTGHNYIKVFLWSIFEMQWYRPLLSLRINNKSRFRERKLISQRGILPWSWSYIHRLLLQAWEFCGRGLRIKMNKKRVFRWSVICILDGISLEIFKVDLC